MELPQLHNRLDVRRRMPGESVTSYRYRDVP
jgi:hypothetical protein